MTLTTRAEKAILSQTTPKLTITYETVPLAPSGLSATPVSASQVNLAWTDNASSESGFKIERKIGATGAYAVVATVGANVTSYSDTGLTDGTIYYYRVKATSNFGDSDLSNQVAVMTGAPPPVANDTHSTTSYAYDPFGNLIQVTDAAGNVTTLSYDLRGRKTGMADPDMGSWSYAYNVLGELVSQTDAKGQVTTLAYDKLGRMVSRSELDLVSTWTFDTCVKGVGKLCQAGADNGYLRTHSYDALGRPQSTTSTMDGSYAVSVSYDANGRVATQTYPTGFAVKYAYTALGYLTEIRNNATNALYFRADTLDAEGRRVQETYGNSVTTLKSFDPATGRLTQILAGPGNLVQNLAYQYDSLGNLLSRQDGNQNQVEDFLYDALNRLTDFSIQGSGITGIPGKQVIYDAIGNLRYKSDVGTYTYGPLNPHAVASISGTVNTSFTYDANGNLTSGNGRTEVYTSYNLPQAMGAPGISLAFYYGPEHQRVKQIAPSGTTYYVHPNNAGALLYEKELKASGVTEHRHYIGAVAIYVTRSDSTTQLRYLHQDHLGSVSAITNETGAVIERLAYDPFGKRRFPNGNDDPGNTIVGQNTDRGYTLHEHLEELGLIHMNGRIYDPLLGRFMSADPQVQFAADGQSYNRYSYGFNNPLSGVDPSGYGWNPVKSLKSAVKSIGHAISSAWKKVWHSDIGRIGVTVAAVYFTGYYDFGSYGYGIFGTADLGLSNALVGGFAGGFVGSGGNLEGGLQGMFAAALFHGAGIFSDGMGPDWGYGSIGRSAAHAVAGCIGAAAARGRCGNGALSAGFAQYAGPKLGNWGPYGNYVRQSVLGGTASVLGGGKFANGAVAGAFGYLFNECSKGGCTMNGKTYQSSEGVSYYEEPIYRQTTAAPQERFSGNVTWYDLPVDMAIEIVVRMPLPSLTVGIGIETGVRFYQFEVGSQLIESGNVGGISVVRTIDAQYGGGFVWKPTPLDPTEVIGVRYRACAAGACSAQ